MQQELAAQRVIGDLVADGKNRVALDRLRPGSGDLAVNEAAVDAQQRNLHMARRGATGAAVGHRCGGFGRRGSGGGGGRQRIAESFGAFHRCGIRALDQIGDGAFLVAAVEQLQQHRQIHPGQHIGARGRRGDADGGVVRTAAEQIDEKQHIIADARLRHNRLVLADQILRPLTGHERHRVDVFSLAKHHRGGIDELLGKPPVAGNN